MTEQERQAALDALYRIQVSAERGVGHYSDYEIVKAALSSPSVPVIDGLEAAINIIDGWGNQDWDARLNPKLDTVLKAARAYAELQKGV